ncbi:DnaB-like helicase C-terminal domain-containing protein [Mycoplasmopsis sturni]|uniref:DnaB-like helicase C-terminal domain-containing protein n=1 Tax=Mycoplasmopsis sturni TaxID=39047 RepID=UPI00055AE766|nr:DnaB-like helicase C-terminal domain-containing protein [Mycoplasmopsis sturni]
MGNKTKPLSETSLTFKNTIDYWKWFSNTLDEPEKDKTKTNWQIFDKDTKGLNPGALYVIAARPGMGKTTLAISLAIEIAKEYNEKNDCVVIFSLETSQKRIYENILSNLMNIPRKHFYKPKKEFYETFREKIENAQPLNILIFDNPYVNDNYIRTILWELNRSNYNIRAVFLDHIQIMSRNYTGTMYETTSKASRELKLIALELNVPIIALSQLSREVEKNMNKTKFIEPTNADLRDSGSIEQDADFIGMIFKKHNDIENYNVLTLKITKNRDGQLKETILLFEPEYSKIYEP